jgi:hypothetical protein
MTLQIQSVTQKIIKSFIFSIWYTDDDDDDDEYETGSETDTEDDAENEEI